MAHDVFISYSHTDKPTADAACATLESRGIRCWIAPRDVLPGDEYASALVGAIHASRLLVLVFSSGANQSPQVLREVERAVSKGLPILPLRIEDVAPSAAMEYYISSRHWLDALTTPLEQHLVQLAETVTLLLARSPGASPPPAPPQAVKPVPPPVEPQTEPREESRAAPAPPAVGPPPRVAEPVAPARPPADPARRAVAGAGAVMLLLLGIDPGVQRGQAIFGFSSSFVSFASMLHLLMLAVGFAAGGLWLRRAEPRRIGTMAGVMLGIGLLLAGFAPTLGGGSGFFLILAGLSSLGAGLGFIVVVTTLLRWFPDRRGMIAGVAAAAFGIGTVATRLLLSAFGFVALAGAGIVTVIVTTLAARRLQVAAGGNSAGVEVKLREALGSWDWYALWLLLFLNTAAASLVLLNILAPDGFMNGHFSEAFMALVAAAPILGRLLLPRISDRRGRRRLLLAILVGQAVLLVTVTLSSVALLFSPYLMLGIMFLSGGLFGIIPALAADSFGDADLGATYGLLLSAWCLALAIVPSALMWGMMLAFLSQPQRYILIAGALLVAAAIAFRLKPPQPTAPRSAGGIAG